MSKNREIIVTGVHGFVGEHLARQLQSSGYDVHGVGREESANENVAQLLSKYTAVNLMEANSTRKIDFRAASAIIHLAGLANVAESFEQPDRYINDNSAMTENLLSAAKEQGFKGRAVIASTGLVYDTSHQALNLTEASATSGLSPYSIGKLAAEKSALTYKGSGINIVIARPFNHIGPGQGDGFLLPDIYKKITTAIKQGNESIVGGNMSSRRDFTDVRDIVNAYQILATTPQLQHDIYNISSGTSHSAMDIYDLLQSTLGTKVEMIIDPLKNRPNDISEITGDYSRIRSELGWRPIIPLSKTVRDFVTSKQRK